MTEPVETPPSETLNSTNQMSMPDAGTNMPPGMKMSH
jgi:hypothetical protein